MTSSSPKCVSQKGDLPIDTYLDRLANHGIHRRLLAMSHFIQDQGNHGVPVNKKQLDKSDQFLLLVSTDKDRLIQVERQLLFNGLEVFAVVPKGFAAPDRRLIKHRHDSENQLVIQLGFHCSDT